MAVHKEEQYSTQEIAISIKSYLGYLRKKLPLLLLALMIGGALGAAYYFNQKPKYEAVCTFIVEEKQSMGGLSGLASQFGFDLAGLGGGGGSIFAGDNILDILKSKKIVQQVLLTKVENSTGAPTLSDLYLDFSNKRNKWKKRQELATISFSNAKQPLSPLHDSVLNIIHEEITEKYLDASRINKKGTIIKVQITAGNSVFARLMTDRLVEEASKMYLNIKTGTAQENISRMQRRSDSLLYLLNRKSYTTAASQPLDINPGIRTAIVPLEIATRDKTVLSTLYIEVTKNLEASKLLLSQQTPIIQLIDRPGISLFDNKRSLPFLIVVTGILAIILCSFFITVLYFLKK